MRRSLLSHGICFVLGVVVVLALVYGSQGSLQNAVAQAGRGGDTPIGNGDVNADGKVDVSDGIWIINHVFRGGPEPVPIECPPTGLPTTGQTQCFDFDRNEIPCDSTEYPGQDGFYQAGCPSQGRFTDNGDGTVTDNCTGLMWQKDTADANGDGLIDGGDRLNWQAAHRYCEDLDYADYTDWRLPNIREIYSIVDYGRRPVIDPVFVALPNRYWSSTTIRAFNPGVGFVVIFEYGYIDGSEGSDCYVRAVRTMQPGE